MLRHFTIENFRSIRDKKTLSLVPIQANNATQPEPVIAIYGANASGKSNILRAMDLMSFMVNYSIKLNDEDDLMYDPFLLNVKSKNAPTHMEVQYSKEGEIVRYGFEYTQNKIEREWLFISQAEGDEIPMFVRQGESIAVFSDFPEGEGKEENTNDNRLFLSLVAQLGGATSKKILRWFSEDFNNISGLQSDDYQRFTLKMLRDKSIYCDKALRFIKDAALGFEELKIETTPFEESIIPAEMPEGIRKELINKMKDKQITLLQSIHNVYAEDGEAVNTISPEVNDFESEGTKKLINLSGPIFDTLELGSVLIVDELDAKMHPLMSRKLISLFLNKETNPYGAQLIFNTHDTNLLTSNLLNEQQIWFTEKDATDGTDLYAFSDLVHPDGTKPEVNKNSAYQYIRGRYGAIPYFKH